MNTTVMAERTAKAMAAIAAEAERLGGQLTLPTARYTNQGVKHLLTLEAIAEGLAGIGAPAAGSEDKPVEALIAVVKEEPGVKEVAPKKRGK